MTTTTLSPALVPLTYPLPYQNQSISKIEYLGSRLGSFVGRRINTVSDKINKATSIFKTREAKSSILEGYMIAEGLWSIGSCVVLYSMGIIWPIPFIVSWRMYLIYAAHTVTK